MSRRQPKAAVVDDGPIKRLQIPATEPQRRAIEDAAGKAGATVNVWALAQLLRAARANGEGVPIVITGEVADRLRAHARQQRVAPDRALELALLALEG